VRGDAKCKRTNIAGLENTDLYQILTYTIATDLPEERILTCKRLATELSPNVELSSTRNSIYGESRNAVDTARIAFVQDAVPAAERGLGVAAALRVE
jgi:hypothetical protein